MEIKVAEHTGFCFGVKRAIRLAEAELDKSKTLYSVGPIIHNPQVVEELSNKGLKAVKDLDGVKDGIFLIPSHGVGPTVIEEAHQKGLRLVNATCPFVMKPQELIKALRKEDYKILIVGRSPHPEIKAFIDCARGKAEVISSSEEAKKLNLGGMKVSVIAQTTQSQKHYLEIVSILLDKDCSELRIFNTICNATVKRQEATRLLAEEVDLVLVIGGRNSSNTSRLAKICEDLGKEVHHIEDKNELKPEWFMDKQSVGISSGASTPDWIVKEVVDRLKELTETQTCGRRM